MSYGTYTFSPVPIVNLTREYKRAEDGRILSAVIKVSLNGFLVSTAGSFTSINTLRDTLSTAFAQNGCLFEVKCGDTTIISKNSRVLALAFTNSPNNWINSLGYTAELEYDETAVGGEIANTSNLDSLSEDWQIEAIEDKPYFSWVASGVTDSRPYLYRLSHTLNAKGRAIYTGCSSGVAEPWQYAANYCSGKVGSSGNLFGVTGSYYNYSRTQAAQKYAGTYSIAENWVVFKDAGISGIPAHALEDFTIDISYPNDTNIITVGVQGTIQGLESASYTGLNIVDKTVATGRYTSALTYFSGVSSRIYNRAQQGVLNSSFGSVRALNPLQYDRTIGHNVGNGVINYNYTYTNKPSPCVANALTENITFNVEYPKDVYASIAILGRAAGPLVQLMGTRTEYQYSMGIDVSVPIVTGCSVANLLPTATGSPHASVRSYLCDMESTLSGTYGTLTKTADNETWNPREGKYARTVTWLAVPCGGAGTAVNDLA